MMKKAVLFGLWGVLTPDRSLSFRKYEETLGVTRGLMEQVVGGASALLRAEKGEMTLTQMIPALEAECRASAGAQGVALPEHFSAQKLLEERVRADFSAALLDLSARLRQQGLRTGVLANIWVDDGPRRDATARTLASLDRHFDLVLRSSHARARVPEPDMFNHALQTLALQPGEVVWVDVCEESVRAAEALGMTAVLMRDAGEAAGAVASLAGVQVSAEPRPPACHPHSVSHGYVNIKPGVKTHYVEMGDGPPVLLCHGFPESWFSWRYQIPALAEAGFRVLALDMKGYGESEAPAETEEFSQEQIMLDLVTFLDKMGLGQVTLVGHDWGGALVWNMAQFHPERVRAVASLNTPLFPVDPNTNPAEKIKALPIFDYQLYFQKPGVAEAELEGNLERTFKLLFSASYEGQTHNKLKTAGVCQRGGLFVGSPDDPPRSSILSEEALSFYVHQYRRSGFRGPLNWYRNGERDWRWMCSRPRGKVLMPALMVTAGKDPVLLPVFSSGMENLVPELRRRHLEECGHWTQMERPAEVNEILVSWLKDTPAQR